MKWTFLVILAIVLFIGAAATYVGGRVVSELRPVRGLLASNDVDSEQVQDAREHVRRALDTLEGPAADFLRLIPIARQNVDAVKGTLSTALPVLEAAGEVTATLRDLEQQDLISRGRVDLDAVSKLESAVAGSSRAVDALERRLEEDLSGWLVPPLYNELVEIERRSHDLGISLRRASSLLAAARPMLGSKDERTYVVLLVNNSELRGAGGIVSGIGRVSASHGRLKLGPFDYYADLTAQTKFRRVPAPPAYARRFERVDANTTQWLNASYSPDVPDVAVVASRLYRVGTGIKSDGVIIADPRGVAALVPAGERLRAPGTDETLDYEEIPDFAYSDAYRLLGGSNPDRRGLLVDLGRAAIGSFLDGGSMDRSSLDRLSDALAGGHLRFVSFHPEQDALADAGVSGDLEPPSNDSVLVTTQNLGADKLDFWMRRKIEHLCDVTLRPVRCATRITLTNKAPSGLPAYVAPRPKANSIQYVEVYVPAAADVTDVNVDGRPIGLFEEPMAGRVSMGFQLKLDRGERSVVTVSYYLPTADDRYDLIATPQTLARDAEIEVSLITPEGWEVVGPGDETEDVVYSGAFDRTLRFVAVPDEAPGLTGTWRAITRSF